MCDGHFDKILTNFKDFPGELLILGDERNSRSEAKFQELLRTHFQESVESLKKSSKNLLPNKQRFYLRASPLKQKYEHIFSNKEICFIYQIWRKVRVWFDQDICLQEDHCYKFHIFIVKSYTQKKNPLKFQ